MRASATGKPYRDMVGYCTNGMMPNRLFSRMKVNWANSSGMNFRKSLLPMRSRPIPSRMNPYAPSPMNCSRPGMIARCRVAASRNQAMSATDTSAMTAGRVRVQAEESLPRIGHQKSSLPGEVNSSPWAAASASGLTASPPGSWGTSDRWRRTPRGASEHESPRTVSEPDQVERQRRSGQQTDQDQPRRPQPVVEEQAQTTVGEQAGQQVADDAPGASLLQRTLGPVVRGPLWRWRDHVVKNRSSGW